MEKVKCSNYTGASRKKVELRCLSYFGTGSSEIKIVSLGNAGVFRSLNYPLFGYTGNKAIMKNINKFEALQRYFVNYEIVFKSIGAEALKKKLVKRS